MKKTFFIFLSVLVLFLQSSCYNEIHIPSSETLPEEIFVQTEITASTNIYEKIVDGQQTDKNLDTSKAITILKILPDNKICFSKKEYKYYDRKKDDETGAIIFTTLDEPEVTYSYEKNGTYFLFKNNQIMFELEDEKMGGPLQNGCYWKYNLTDDEFIINKILNIQIDGGLTYKFSRKKN